MIHSEIPEVYPQLPEGNGVPGTALYQKQKTSQSLILPYFHPFSNPTFFFFFSSSEFWSETLITLIFASEDFRDNNDHSGIKKSSVASWMDKPRESNQPALTWLSGFQSKTEPEKTKKAILFSVSGLVLALADTEGVTRTDIPWKHSRGRRSWPARWWWRRRCYREPGTSHLCYCTEHNTAWWCPGSPPRASVW